ncbi:MAG: DUF1801 domain-containing protein [Bacteroidota bacterium]
MITTETDSFLKQYDDVIYKRALALREMVLANLPDCTELVDFPARMIAYSYGPKYADLICVIIPSKKGLKLGFNRGTSLPDPDGLLEGTGKISRYIKIESDTDIHSKPIKDMILNALELYLKNYKS